MALKVFWTQDQAFKNILLVSVITLIKFMKYNDVMSIKTVWPSGLITATQELPSTVNRKGGKEKGCETPTIGGVFFKNPLLMVESISDNFHYYRCILKNPIIGVENI